MRLVMEIKTIEELDKAISDGPYTQLGCYPKYFVTNDGGILSFKSVVENIELIKFSTANTEGLNMSEQNAVKVAQKV